ncbi:hypothetical protein BDR22DRAFT_593722 [Usnea florida]
MISLTFSLLYFIALSAAQNQTASLFIPNADAQSLVGSIVGGDATATTYLIQCANDGSNGAAATTAAAASTTAAAAATTDVGDDLDSDSCGFPSPVTVVEGPSTVAYALTLDDSVASVNCVLSGTSIAVCTASASGAILTQETGVPTLTSTTLSGTDVSFMPVVITAGSVTNTASTPSSTTASTTGGSKAGSNGGSTSPTGGTQTQTGSTTSASTQATGAAVHRGAAMGMGAAGALAAVAAVVL